MVKKIIIIGVDGATPEVLFKWADDNLLPNFGALRREGCSGKLRARSLVSPVSWATHYTGVEPEVHGISDFVVESSIGESSRWIRTLDYRVKTYFELLAEQGVRVGVINPVALYPPLELKNGFFVGGPLTPVGETGFFHPSGLSDKLGDYEIDFVYGDRRYGFVDDTVDVDRQTVATDQFRIDRKRVRVAFELLDEAWDMFFITFKGSDIMQHLFWHLPREGQPLFSNPIFRYFKLLDNFVGEIRKRYPDAAFLVLSDHGFGERRGVKEQPTAKFLWRIMELGKRWFPNNWKGDSILFDTFKKPYRLLYRLLGDSDPEKLVTGNHRWDGIWMLASYDIKHSFRRDLQFLDLNPLIFYLLARPIPSAFQGQLVEDIFVSSPEPVYTDLDITAVREKELDRAVHDRLEALGYIEMVKEAEDDHPTQDA